VRAFLKAMHSAVSSARNSSLSGSFLPFGLLKVRGLSAWIGTRRHDRAMSWCLVLHAAAFRHTKPLWGGPSAHRSNYREPFGCVVADSEKGSARTPVPWSSRHLTENVRTLSEVPRRGGLRSSC
jgi:hypothetical protein